MAGKSRPRRHDGPDDFRAAVGRLSFVCGALEWEKPFMAPLFNFLSRRKRGGLQAVPLYIRVVCRFLSEQVKRRRMYPSASTKSIGVEAFRVDAEAEGDAIRIGGWLPTRAEDRRIATEASPWFAIELDRRSAP